MGQFQSFDGVEIIFDDVQPDRGGVPVVLHHGFAADAATNWAGVGIIERLAATGRRVVALDARGHGRSGKPHDPGAYDSPAMARDVAALFDHLGLEEVDLVGYSMGAFVSLEVATSDTRLRSLVLGGIGSGAIPNRDGAGPPVDRSAIAEAMETVDASQITAPGAAGFRALADATGADRAALAAVLRSEPHRPGDLSTVTIPTLVLVGDNDPLAHGADRLAEQFSRGHLQVVAGDHLSAVGTPAFIDGLIAFLDSVAVK